MKDGKMTFRDVCNIMMPMLGYYDLYSDKDIKELRMDLGLYKLNMDLSNKFTGNYIKAKEWYINHFLEEAITDYIKAGNIVVYYDEENDKGASKFVLSKKKCGKEIAKYSEIYGQDEVKTIRKHIRSKALHKIKEPENPKYLAEFL